jgi:hypothetical protein
MKIDFRVFASCRTEREIARAFGELDEYMTPIELGMLVARRDEVSAPVRKRLEAIVRLAPFAGQQPQDFHRMPIHPDVTLYRDPKVGAARKKLIVAFCGARNRLDMPLAAVLQSLPSREVDIAVFRDRTKHHYLKGIADYASGFLDLTAAIIRDLRPAKYRETYAYGTSMGGFAAVRYSLLHPVRRAVSMVGSFPGHVRRLVDRQALPAFDLLCDCVAGSARTEIVSVFGDGSERDRQNSEWLARICGAKEVAVPHVTGHNVAHALAVSGTLPAFFAGMFELDGGAGGAGGDWLGLPGAAAVPIVSAA